MRLHKLKYSVPQSRWLPEQTHWGESNCIVKRCLPCTQSVNSDSVLMASHMVPWDFSESSYVQSGVSPVWDK